MKTPKIIDFDPDAKIPALTFSLKDMPAIQKPPSTDHIRSRQNTSKVILHDEQPTHDISNIQATLQPQKRSYVRRTFDFYEDQITYLTRQSLQERLAGNERSMNEMVREALDDWIKKRTTEK